MEAEERAAYIYGGTHAAEYLKEIRKTDLSTLTGEEFVTFCECMCKNYHLKYVELTDEIPF